MTIVEKKVTNARKKDQRGTKWSIDPKSDHANMIFGVKEGIRRWEYKLVKPGAVEATTSPI